MGSNPALGAILSISIPQSDDDDDDDDDGAAADDDDKAGIPFMRLH